MAKMTSVNVSCDSGTGPGAAIMFEIKRFLKTVGWTIPSSSDGTTYNASADQITSAASGAAGMDNALAWFRMRDPGGTREWTIQRATSSSEQNWRIKYSAVSKFSGGSPSATQTPSAADEAIIWGSGTDASPTMATMFPSGSDPTYVHCVAYTNATNTVYPFFILGTDVGAGTGRFFWCHDAIVGGPSADADKSVQIITGNGTMPTLANLTTTTGNICSAWYKHGLAGANYGETPACKYTQTSDMYPDGSAVNPYTGDDDGLPLLFGRNVSNYASTAGVKGWALNLRWCGIAARVYPDTAGLSTADAYAYVATGILMMPWEQNTAPAVT